MATTINTPPSMRATTRQLAREIVHVIEDLPRFATAPLSL